MFFESYEISEFDEGTENDFFILSLEFQCNFKHAR